MIKSARNNGTWTGAGITTSEPLAVSQITGLAVATASEANRTTFAGATVSASDVLVMYTWTGDANLSGFIDGDDFTLIDNGYSTRLAPTPLLGYHNGDFDYNGRIDADDYFLIDRAYANQTTPFVAGATAAGAVAVPEPTASMLVVAGASLLARRRR
jgi:hypothetical protein